MIFTILKGLDPQMFVCSTTSGLQIIHLLIQYIIYTKNKFRNVSAQKRNVNTMLKPGKVPIFLVMVLLSWELAVAILKRPVHLHH